MRFIPIVVLSGVVALSGCGQQKAGEPAAAENTKSTETSTSDVSAEAHPKSAAPSNQDSNSANEETSTAGAAHADNAPSAQAEVEAPFPYTAVINCGLDGFENRVVLMGCMSHNGVTTELELTNGDQYGMYKGYNMPNDWPYTKRGLEIPLSKHFQLKIQNAAENLMIGVRIFDNNGNIVFQKQASHFGVIEVQN